MSTVALDFLSADVIPAGDLDAADMAAWRAICAANPALSSPFFSPEFTAAVAHVRPDVHVAAFRERSLPLAYLPFQFTGPWARRSGAAERVGGELSDFFGLIAGVDTVIPAAELLRQARLNTFAFSHLLAEQADILHGEQPDLGFRVMLAESWEDYWAGLRASDRTFVTDTERSRRRLAEDVGPLTFRFENRDARTLPALIAAKRTQYRATGVGDPLGEKWTRDLLTVLAQTRSIQCTGILSTLAAGDTWVASHFGLASARTLHSWFPVHNPELGRYSPGRLLMREIIEAASRRGLASVDFGAGDQPYKRKFATGDYRVYRGQLYRPNMSAFGIRMAQSIAWRLKPAAGAKTH